MFKKLKALLLVLTCFVVALSLIGCNEEEPVTTLEVNRTNQIPEDGVIERAVFESIQYHHDIGVFNGSNNNIDFQWLFMGNHLDELQDKNLMINFSNARTAQVRAALDTNYVQEFSFASTGEVGGSPTLTFHLGTLWDVDEVIIYDHDSGEIAHVAAVDQGPHTIITFSPTHFTGLFYIVGFGEMADVAGDVASIANFLGIGMQASAGPTSSGESQNQGQAASNQGETATSQNTTTSNQSSHDSSSTPPEGSSTTGNNSSSSDQTRDPSPPQDQAVNPDVELTATLTISVRTLLNNMDLLSSNLHPLVPENGLIMATRTVTFSEGESVFDVLQRETRASGIHMVHRTVPAFNSVYIESIGNLGEFDAGSLSGWVYKVNGWGPNFGASQYILEQGDVIEWHFTVDLGRDVGVYVGNQ